MLSLASMASGKGFYYTNLAREDYYTAGGEPPGRWHGAAAERLGLTGEVEKEALARLLEGFAPDGSKLVQNAGKPNRQAGLDLTFSADKSVSVLWALGDQDTRRALEEAHSRAVDVALGYLQQEAGWTRRGKDGEHFERADLVFAKFLHSTSRAQDPNLHTHVLCPNLCIREDGSTGAVWNNELYWHKMTAGALYRVALAYELGPRGLGLAIEADSDRGLFRLRDVPKKLNDHFSKRRAQIELELQENGHSKTAAASAKAALDTRHVKGHVARKELFERWQAEAQELGYTRGMPAKLGQYELESKGRRLNELAHQSAETLAETRGTFRSHDLVRTMAKRLQGGLDAPHEVLEAARAELQGADVVEVLAGKRNPILTTRSELVREDSLLRTASKLNGAPGLTVSPLIADIVKETHASALGSTEREAAFDHLTAAAGNLKILAGVAGTGKTSLLRAAREAWEKQGFTVVGMALSGKAARELEQGSGIQSETVAKRELQLAPTLLESIAHHATGFYRATRWGGAKLVRGEWVRSKKFEETGPIDRITFGFKTVVVIDESSMLGLEDTARTLQRAAAAGAKVVLVGDERQLPAIESVSPFEALSEHVGRFELTEIKRQEKPWMRDAVRAFAEGDSRTGLSLLQENGSLKLSRGGPTAMREELVADWLRSGTDPSEKLILTATSEEARDLNARTQAARLKAGHLRNIFTMKLGSGESAYIGDRVLFGRNHRGMDVRNGETGTVVSFHRALVTTRFNPGAIAVRTDNGRKVRVGLARYKDISLGYALTTHKAQGTTVDEAFVYTTPKHVSRDMLYVQTSRHRTSIGVYARGHDLGEDLADLERGAKRESTKAELAIDVQHAHEQERARSVAEARAREEERERTWERTR